MHAIPRRRLLLTLGGGLLGAGALGRSWQHRLDDASSSSARLHTITRSSHALGSTVSVTVLHADKAAAHQAIEAMLAELDRIEDLLSLYRPHSQLCRLNRDGVLEDPHPDLLAVLESAQSMSVLTGGAFDVTVQPLWALYQQAAKGNALPDEAALAAARKLVDYRRLEIEPNRIRLAQPGAAVTLNGIAQGYAADRAQAVLREHGIEHALIDAGELAPLGNKAGGVPWIAGIQHPREADAYIELARLERRCLATSGDYATRFCNDHRHHHILDPGSGRSPAELASVSVIAPSAMLADALSTAVFVLGAERGFQLVERQRDVDALLVLKDGGTRRTAGFPAAT